MYGEHRLNITHADVKFHDIQSQVIHKVSEYDLEMPPSHMQNNPPHRNEEHMGESF